MVISSRRAARILISRTRNGTQIKHTNPCSLSQQRSAAPLSSSITPLVQSHHKYGRDAPAYHAPPLQWLLGFTHSPALALSQSPPPSPPYPPLHTDPAPAKP